MRHNLISTIFTLLTLLLLCTETEAYHHSPLSIEELIVQLQQSSKQIETILSQINSFKQVVLVMGATGAGKTTLINYLADKPLLITKIKNIQGIRSKMSKRTNSKSEKATTQKLNSQQWLSTLKATFSQTLPALKTLEASKLTS